MKNLLLVVIFLLSSGYSHAWKLTPVLSKDQPVGYIYSTEAEGTQIFSTRASSFTSIRFICSLKGGDPVVALLWVNGLNSPQETLIDISVDNVSAIYSGVWLKDENLLYKNIADSNELLMALKNSKITKFQFKGLNSETYITGFNTTGFDLTDFSAKCKL